jgi:hypothetical protein
MGIEDTLIKNYLPKTELFGGRTEKFVVIGSDFCECQHLSQWYFASNPK